MAFDIVPTRLAIKAMRDSGYRNAAYAIAELVDNAIQANAKLVEILCKEDEGLVQERRRRRVKEIAVVDNGDGMSEPVLRKALQFGNGERLDDRSGIGRFGMGLPNSSISQARRVDVWTWTDSCANAIYTYLDVAEIESGDIREVPEPVKRPVPADWKRISSTLGKSKSGTLVVWSELDKCDWKTAQAIFRNSEFTIGRVYRRFIDDGRARIRMASFLGSDKTPDFDEDVRANDPMYQMKNTSCPPPWNSTPMFEAYGEPHKIQFKHGKKNSVVTVGFAIAKKEAREGHNPGGEPHGKHAKDNLGVSIIRADRELELQTAWCDHSEPRDRWWKVEVDFPPDLDEVFGVTNNKQSARALAEIATLDSNQIAEREGFKSYHELDEAWTEDNDARRLLLKVKTTIEKNISVMRSSIKAQTERKQSRLRHSDIDSAEMRGTKATELRKQEGHEGTSDGQEGVSAAERETSIAKALIEQGLDQEEAATKAKNVLIDGRKFEFSEADLQTPELFTVRPKGGAILIALNTSHPAYEHLIALMQKEADTDDVETLRARQRQSFEGLKLLIEAWARYEDEVTDGKKKELVQGARMDWGRVARDFFREE